MRHFHPILPGKPQIFRRFQQFNSTVVHRPTVFRLQESETKSSSTTLADRRRSLEGMLLPIEALHGNSSPLKIYVAPKMEPATKKRKRYFSAKKTVKLGGIFFQVGGTVGSWMLTWKSHIPIGSMYGIFTYFRWKMATFKRKWVLFFFVVSVLIHWHHAYTTASACLRGMGRVPTRELS